MIRTEQIPVEFLESISFDLAFAASGYESRGIFLFNSFKNITCKNKIVIGFENYLEDPIRIINDESFKKLSFEPIISSGNECEKVIEICKNYLKANQSSELNILVDYSCMTRIWYAEILKYLYYISNRALKINIYFCYSFSAYVPPPQEKPLNKFVGPIKGFYSITVPAKPTALIIGLGYVSTRAFGLAEYFDVMPHVFIADASFNEKFYYDVVEQNNELIKSVLDENIFYYPLNNLNFSETLLNHLCQDLLSNFRVVLAPCGPKPFTLLSLITSLRLRDVDVWRISAGENEAPHDVKPYGTISVLKCTLISSELS